MLQKIIRVEDVGCGMKKMDENGKIRGYPESDFRILWDQL